MIALMNFKYWLCQGEFFFSPGGLFVRLQIKTSHVQIKKIIFSFLQATFLPVDLIYYDWTVHLSILSTLHMCLKKSQ